MLNTDLDSCSAGLNNLITICMQVMPGDRVLLVLEPENSSFYDPAIGRRIEQYLNKLGAEVSCVQPALVSDPKDFPETIFHQMNRSEHTLFLTRLGDYVRFTPMMGSGTVTLCYARQLDQLESQFCGMSHHLMSQLLQKLESELLQATQWRITCDLGTNLHGTFCWPSLEGGVDDEFSMALFPVTTFKPVPCNTANGTVALSRWLMPGAAVKVGPAVVNFDGTVFADVEDGRLVNLSGEDLAVQTITDYLDLVSTTLGTSRDRIHSWHAGVNPFTTFTSDVDNNLEAWGAITFASPRYLHFHTAGDVPPGEVAWSIFNPTVFIDDQCFWRDGEFTWLQREDNRALLETTPEGSCLLQPSADIGV